MFFSPCPALPISTQSPPPCYQEFSALIHVTMSIMSEGCCLKSIYIKSSFLIESIWSNSISVVWDFSWIIKMSPLVHLWLVIRKKKMTMRQYAVTRMLEIKDLDSPPTPVLFLPGSYFSKWHYHKSGCSIKCLQEVLPLTIHVKEL